MTFFKKHRIGVLIVFYYHLFIHFCGNSFAKIPEISVFTEGEISRLARYLKVLNVNLKPQVFSCDGRKQEMHYIPIKSSRNLCGCVYLEIRQNRR